MFLLSFGFSLWSARRIKVQLFHRTSHKPKNQVLMERTLRLPSIDVVVNKREQHYLQWVVCYQNAGRKTENFAQILDLRMQVESKSLWVFAPSNWYNRFHKLCVHYAYCKGQIMKWPTSPRLWKWKEKPWWEWERDRVVGWVSNIHIHIRSVFRLTFKMHYRLMPRNSITHSQAHYVYHAIPLLHP